MKSEGKYFDAKYCCQRALDLQPNNSEAYFLMGSIINNLENPHEALYYINRSLSIDPENIEALQLKHGILFRMRRININEAITDLDAAISNNLDDENIWIAKGEYYIKYSLYKIAKDPREALECFDKAIAINKNNSKAHFLKARTYFISSQYSDALVCYDNALAIEPINPDFWSAKGKCLFEMAKEMGGGGSFHESLKNAQACIDKALNIDPKHISALKHNNDIKHEFQSKNVSPSNFNSNSLKDKCDFQNKYQPKDFYEEPGGHDRFRYLCELSECNGSFVIESGKPLQPPEARIHKVGETPSSIPLWLKIVAIMLVLYLFLTLAPL